MSDIPDSCNVLLHHRQSVGVFLDCRSEVAVMNSTAPSTSTSPAPSVKKISGKKIPAGGRQPKLSKVQSLHSAKDHVGLKSLDKLGQQNVTNRGFSIGL